MISIMADVMQTSGVLGSQDEGVLDSFYHNLLGNPRIREFCENSQREMKALDAAFLPLFNRVIMSAAGSPAYLKAIHLRLKYLGAYLFEDPPQYLRVETVRARTASFREYLSLAEIALRTARHETENPAHRLSLQCGLTWNLFLLAFFCRDPLARDEAILMLKDYPGQDGLWNTRSLYVLALRNRGVEQANAVEGTSTEQWQRLWRREFVFEDGGERIVFRYLERDGVTGQWQSVEEAAEVQAESEDVCWKRQPLIGSGGLLMADLYTAESSIV
ncbi:putative c6 zinc finger domain-containing protein [Neofusicoccum parvum UCRNP2]|uniref:Putative c6 zinc finger domain-containing protein n=1 Tax=Botryosphaeria parva (strain UCR-NP2) TaxID=1287680 RepID=R1GG25_BOTPV|nr:putative c6 zinc finger domain-containing protein [Neofusicoccum parvum UCRNP2]